MKHIPFTALLGTSILLLSLTACGGGSVQVSSTGAKLVSLSVTPTDPSIAVNTTQQLRATGIYSDNSTKDLTSDVTWSSGDANIADVENAAASSAAGLLFSIKTLVVTHAVGKAVGKTTVRATSGDVSGSTTITVTPATLVSVAVTPANPGTAKGTTRQFSATGTFSDNTTQDLTGSAIWASSDSSVAAISNTAGSAGLAQATAAGTTTITASASGASGSTVLTVSPASLVSLSISPADSSIAKGVSRQFAASGVYSDGSTQDMTTTVAWSSSNSAVAQISNAIGSNGLAVPTGTGTTTITAASGSVSASTTLTVTSATLVSLAVTPANPSIAKGTNQQFAATGTYSDGTSQVMTAAVTWNSSNTGVAQISNAAGSNGLAVPVAAGSAAITAASGSVSASTTLTVTPATLVSITLSPSSANISVNTTKQFTAMGTYSDGSAQDLTASVTWSASNASVAQISNASGSNGLATGLAAGSITISAISGSVSGTATLTVAAPNPATGTFSWTAATLYSDGSQLAAAGIKGHRVYVATTPGAYNLQSFVFVAAPATSVALSSFNLSAGQYYFAVTTVDASDMESDFSNEVAVTL